MGNRLFWLGVAAVALIVLAISSYQVMEVLNADQVMVIQYPNGSLTWFTEQGPHVQMFGAVQKYARRGQFWFSTHIDQGEEGDQSIKIRFNDAAHAKLSGSLSYELPINDMDAMMRLHRNYGSIEAIEAQLIRTVTEKCVYMTGPLMSSQESYSSKRNQLLGFIDDQIVNGVYKTQVKVVKDKDPMTGADRTVNITEIVVGKDGQPQRQDESPIASYKIKIFNLSLNEVKYDPAVEAQIGEQQRAIQQVQLAIAQAKEAEQKAITTAKQGEANAAEAKWKQETIKAQAVTQAQQDLEVATFATKTAVQYKAKKILEAEAEYEYKRKIILGDGALTQKLATYQAVMEKFAAAVGQQKWVPDVVFEGTGGGGKSGYNSATSLIDMLSVKTARDLALDLSIPKK
jgi:regulator of protease activity HflC (stomatin/prohibitin superfamily)